MFASVKSNGSSDFGRMRSTFHAWKNSCETVPSRPIWFCASEADDVTDVELRCSIPSPAQLLR
jgi:hypothetical protein